MNAEVVLLALLLATWVPLALLWLRVAGLSAAVAALPQRRDAQEVPAGAALDGAVAQLDQAAEAADELASALASRVTHLQCLLGEADRRIEALESSSSGPVRDDDIEERRRTKDESLASFVPSASAGPAPGLASDGERSPGSSLPVPPARGDAAVPARATVPGAASYEEVRRLAAAGLSPAEIAQRTHRGREEVRLLLQLTHQQPHVMPVMPASAGPASSPAAPAAPALSSAVSPALPDERRSQ